MSRSVATLHMHLLWTAQTLRILLTIPYAALVFWQTQEEAETATSRERVARQIVRERSELAALPEVGQGHALQVSFVLRTA